MSVIANRVKVAVDGTPGTGTINLGAAVTGFQSFADGGITNGQVVSYAIEDGDAWEIGTGTYTTGTPNTLSRTVIESSNSDAALDLTSNAVVFITALSGDLQNAVDMDQGVATTDSPDFAGLSVNGNPIATAGPLSNRNKIINGNFGINQRAVSGTVTLSAGAYGHDRWKAGASGCTYTFATSANVTTITISAGSLVQVIEGLNLQSGTHVLSWTGTVQMKINGGSAGNSGMTGTLTGGTNATVETSGTGTLSLVQLEAGDTATPFEHRSYEQELALCQRYYSIFRPQARAASVGFMVTPYYLPVKMRATPTLTQISAGNSNLASIQGLVSEYDTGGYFQINVTGANGFVLSAIYSASAEL
jgi:hypothetical protein